MDIYAHRCRGFGHPESTVRAIRAALQSNVDGIELDVRLTKDLKWVVVHDAALRSERNMVRRVHERTYAKLRREVTDLDAALALFAGMGDGKEVLIDVKDVGAERSFVRMLERYGITDRAVVIAWEPEVLKRLHALSPTLRLGLSYVPIHERLRKVKVDVHRPLTRQGILLKFNELHSFDTKFALGSTHQHYLSEMPDLPLHSIQVFSLFCSAKLVRKAHERGVRVIAFVVNNRIAESLLRRRGVDGILTDAPASFI